jgi:cytochrome c oxidase subunit IV
MTPEAKSHQDHITSVKVYLLAGATLLILTVLTVKVSTIHLGAWNAIVALAIASAKALLVTLFFMHLLHDKKIYAVVMSTALIFLGIFLGLTMADVLRRGDINQYEAQPIKPEAGFYSHPKSDTTGTVPSPGAADSSQIH